MATLVKFYLENDGSGDVFAVFPQLNYNKRLYGTTQKQCYAHTGQHSSCTLDYVNGCEMATKSEYSDLLQELKSIGYDCKVLNKGFRIEQYTLPLFWASALVNDDTSGMDDNDEKELTEWLNANKPGSCTGVSEDTNFSTFNGYGTEVSEFTFIKH